MINEYLEGLQEAGLTLNESKVYLALVQNGPSRPQEIAKESGVHRVNVYDSIRKLKQRGFVTTMKKYDKEFFQAVDPQVLMSHYMERKARIQEVIGNLDKIKGFSQKETEVALYEGFSAVKNVYMNFLKIDKERVVYGAQKAATKYFKEFFNFYHQKRVLAKRKIRHIYNTDAMDRVEYLNKLPYTEARCLEKEFDSPVSTSICGSQVALTLWSQNPLVIVIDNKKIADAYRNYFELLWQKAHKRE